jgi:hypothetical protein
LSRPLRLFFLEPNPCPPPPPPPPPCCFDLSPMPQNVLAILYEVRKEVYTVPAACLSVHIRCSYIIYCSENPYRFLVKNHEAFFCTSYVSPLSVESSKVRLLFFLFFFFGINKYLDIAVSLPWVSITQLQP